MSGSLVITRMHLVIRHYMLISPFLHILWTTHGRKRSEGNTTPNKKIREWTKMNTLSNSRIFLEHMPWQTLLDSRIRVMKETVEVLALSPSQQRISKQANTQKTRSVVLPLWAQMGFHLPHFPVPRLQEGWLQTHC